MTKKRIYAILDEKKHSYFVMPEEQNKQSNKQREDDGQKTLGILDTVSFSHTTAALRSFNPQTFISVVLQHLNPREKQVLTGRYGLTDGHPQTLEHIGKILNLTRERVRQIESECFKKLNNIPLSTGQIQTANLIFQVIEENGNIMVEKKLLNSLLASNDTEIARKGVLFILNLVPRFNFFKETEAYRSSWHINGFNQEFLAQVISATQEALEKLQKPVAREVLSDRTKKQSDNPEIQTLSAEIFESYISVSKEIDKNAFQEWGLVSWREIHPKDIGDKAYLVLLHHGSPEHYSKITELINKQGFDRRVAHKETVHNELIRDARFVLIGRGIYALKKWGYKKGIVAEIIQDVLQNAGKSLNRDEIIEAVLRQRMVKKNTIVVGLSNRKLFGKTPDDKYTNV